MTWKPAIARRPKTIAELKQIQSDLIELSKPFVRAKCELLASVLPTITLYPDGRIDHEYSADVEAELARIDAELMREYGRYLARNELL